ncbi:MAG: MinD/ParA family protein [Pseudohongiellaceae bacterium]|nr:MinD/ParA family protein [Pseudohongiellaceae bacterium]
MKPVQVLAITGGKGGVGKTNVSVNLSLALAEAGKRVILMDADLGLANVDIQLGIKADKTLEDVLNGECGLRDILITTAGGIKVIPAASGVQSLTQLPAQAHAGLIQAFSELDEQLDVLIIDTAAGISDSVVSFVRAAQEVMVVVCDEPSSITDAYALVKLLNRDYGMTRFRVLANMTRSPEEGKALYGKFVKVAERFLDVSLQYAGDIPWDESVRKSAQRQRAAIEAYPSSKCAVAYRRLAKEMMQWPVARQASGGLEFFVERLLMSDAGELAGASLESP